MRRLHGTALRWMAVAITALGVIAMASHRARSNAHALTSAADALLDCAFYAEEGETCEREERELTAFPSGQGT